jgi:bifunctional DNA-binding transcriptional regulator/antitoxin component of YhaV-PrlF toxin-antitoxin module
MTDPKEPLFTAKVGARGQITIREDVRKRKGILPGDDVEIYDLKKVYK